LGFVASELMTMAAADRPDLDLQTAAPDVDLGLDVLVDVEEQLATRAAWLYFVAENTQAQIGKKLGLTRVRVNRLLAHARQQGLVQVTITGRMASSIQLEEALKKRFGLLDAVVVPSASEVERQRVVIAAAAGSYLAQHLRDGMSVGVGWGQTLRHSLRYVPHRNYKGLSVVSLIGGLTHSSAVNPHETASHLADIVGGQCYYLAAPAFTDTEATREVLMNQPMLRDVYERGRKVDLAFVSVGELGKNSTMAKLALISAGDVASLQSAGAVGDLCSHWLDARGQVVDHPLNRRCVALPPEHLRDVERVVLVSGGKNKVAMIRGVLSNKLANSVVTDEQTAKALLDHSPR
jgi:DNA-binding transcriptional regulator LsrR (DeoR family)